MADIKGRDGFFILMWGNPGQHIALREKLLEEGWRGTPSGRNSKYWEGGAVEGLAAPTERDPNRPVCAVFVCEGAPHAAEIFARYKAAYAIHPDVVVEMVDVGLCATEYKRTPDRDSEEGQLAFLQLQNRELMAMLGTMRTELNELKEQGGAEGSTLPVQDVSDEETPGQPQEQPDVAAGVSVVSQAS